MVFKELLGWDDGTVILFAVIVFVFAWIIGNWQLPHWKKGAERRL